MNLRLTTSLIAAGLTLGCCFAVPAAGGDASPVIVVPGKLGVPVIINGVDVTGAIVYGEWGLSQPGHGQIIIEGGMPAPRQAWRGSYFPATGQPPTYGRDEVEPPPRKRPSTDFHQSWSAGSENAPATEQPTVEPPTVILAPRDRPDRPKPPPAPQAP